MRREEDRWTAEADSSLSAHLVIKISGAEFILSPRREERRRERSFIDILEPSLFRDLAVCERKKFYFILFF